MTDAIDALGAAGPGEQLVAGGKVWSLRHVGPGVRAAFSAWAKLQARQEVQGCPELQAALVGELAAGAYRWGTPLNPKAMGSAVARLLGETDGQVRLVQLLLEPAHGEVAPAQVLEILAADPDGAAAAVRACLGLGPVDPNPQAPATA